MVLVHLVKLTWHLVQFWQPEVTLLEYVLLVQLWDGQVVGAVPALDHGVGEARLHLDDSVGGS